MRRLAPVFACLLVLLLGFAGYQAAFVPVAAIRVEINRAVELGVNRLGRVVSSSGLNEDGEALAEEENVWFLPYGEAIDRLLENSRVANCLAQGETVSIGVVTDDEDEAASMTMRALRERLLSLTEGSGEDGGSDMEAEAPSGGGAGNGYGAGSGYGQGAGEGNGSGNGYGNGHGAGNGAGNGNGRGGSAKG